MTADVTTIEQLDVFAQRMARTLMGGEVLLLSGPLGAGKTTFVQCLAKHLGVAERITSPTFTLMHLHDAPHAQVRQLVHIDAYRLSGQAELAAIGVEDYIGKPGVVTVIEWGEKVAALAKQKKVIAITFSVQGEKRRAVLTRPRGTPRQRS